MRKINVLFLVLLSCLIAITSHMPIYFIKQIIDVGIQENDIILISKIGALLTANVILFSFVKSIRLFYIRKINFRIISEHYNTIFSKLFKIGVLEIKRLNSSKMLNTIAEDVKTIGEKAILPISNIIYNIIMFVVGVTVIATVNKMVLFYVLPFGIISSFFAKKININSSKNMNELREETQNISNSFGEGFKGILTIKLNNLEERSKNELMKNSKRITHIGNKQAVFDSKNFFLLSTLYNITIQITIVVSAIMVINQSLSVGELLVLVMYSHMIVDPLVALIDDQNGYVAFKVAKNRINDFLNINEERRSKNYGPVDKIIVTDLDYTIGEFELNLKNICVSKGESLYLLGKSGSGKTTTAFLLANIYINNKVKYYYKGQEKKYIPNVAFAMQDEYIFDLSIKDNIKFVNEDLSDAEINKILDDVHLTELNARFKDEKVGEAGVKLSGGERQRIRIARILAKSNADVYIFDELTSGLDELIANDIRENVYNQLSDKIMIFIEHEKKDYMDKVICL